MAFAEDLINNSYAFSSHSMSAPLFGSSARLNAMENWQFGATMPNNRDHLEMQQRRQQQQQRRGESKGMRRRQVKSFIYCRYCPNKMPPQHMAGHLERKHNIPPGSSDDHAPSAKRRRAVLDSDDDDDYADDDCTTTELHVQKRARPNANSTSIREQSPVDAIIRRPETPPSPPAIGNLSNANRANNNHASTSQVVCVRNEACNLVYISDRELNKFMRDGRVEIYNGRLILKDSIEQE